MPAKTWQSVGCEACQQTGYRGRIGVFEIWHKHESDYQLMLEHADERVADGDRYAVVRCVRPLLPPGAPERARMRERLRQALIPTT